MTKNGYHMHACAARCAVWSVAIHTYSYEITKLIHVTAGAIKGLWLTQLALNIATQRYGEALRMVQNYYPQRYLDTTFAYYNTRRNLHFTSIKVGSVTKRHLNLLH